jgi:hypothetical protein
MPGGSWLADCDRLDELRERAGTGGYHASRELARLLADHDLLDELRDRISASGGHYALRELARRLIERDMHQELRELIEAADADTRQLILDAAGGASSAWPNALRVLADFGHKASRMHLARTLAREGRLEELRQRAGDGDEYARYWLELRGAAAGTLRLPSTPNISRTCSGPCTTRRDSGKPSIRSIAGGEGSPRCSTPCGPSVSSHIWTTRRTRSPVTAPRCGRPRPPSARLAAPSSPRKFKIDQSERQHASPGPRMAVSTGRDQAIAVGAAIRAGLRAR